MTQPAHWHEVDCPHCNGLLRREYCNGDNECKHPAMASIDGMLLEAALNDLPDHTVIESGHCWHCARRVWFAMGIKGRGE